MDEVRSQQPKGGEKKSSTVASSKLIIFTDGFDLCLMFCSPPALKNLNIYKKKNKYVGLKFSSKKTSIIKQNLMMDRDPNSDLKEISIKDEIQEEVKEDDDEPKIENQYYNRSKLSE